jgi:hypothetical protein
MMTAQFSNSFTAFFGMGDIVTLEGRDTARYLRCALLGVPLCSVLQSFLIGGVLYEQHVRLFIRDFEHSMWDTFTKKSRVIFCRIGSVFEFADSNYDGVYVAIFRR